MLDPQSRFGGEIGFIFLSGRSCCRVRNDTGAKKLGGVGIPQMGGGRCLGQSTKTEDGLKIRPRISDV